MLPTLTDGGQWLMERDLRSRRLWLMAALLAMVVALVGLYLLRGALLTLGISLVIAYVLLPLARLLERAMPWREKRPLLSRVLAVSVIFLTALGALVAAGVMVISSIIRQGQRFVESFPQFLDAARWQVELWVADYNRLMPPQVRDRAEEWLSNAGGLMGDAALNIASQTLGAITGSFSFIIGLATAPVLIFYLMKDADPIRESLYTPFPAKLRPYLRDLMDIVNRSVGGYIRGQLVLGLLVGVVVTVGLMLLGIPFAVILGIVAGLTELIPIIGPWIGGAVGVLVTLATEPDKVLWVILLYFGVQMLENALLVPRVQANTLGIHPIVVILVITVGSQYFGLWGVVLGPPLAAMVKGVVAYAAGEWNRMAEVVDDGVDAAEADTVVAVAAGEDGE